MAAKKTKKTSASKTRKPVKAKKPAARKATRASAPAKKPASLKKSFEKVSKTRTKSQVIKELCETTGLSKKDVDNIFNNLQALIKNDLTKGPGTFQMPGLMKLSVVRKKAVPARKGINPFTGEEMMFKAKPATNVVKARPLKNLKDMVQKK